MRTSIALLAFVAAATAAPFRFPGGFGGQGQAEGCVRPSGTFPHPEHTGSGFPHHSGSGFPGPRPTGSFPFPSGTRPGGPPTGAPTGVPTFPEGGRPWERRQAPSGTGSAPEGRPTDGFPGAGGPPNGGEGGFPGFPGASGSFPHPSGTHTWTRDGSRPTDFPGAGGEGGRPHHHHRP